MGKTKRSSDISGRRRLNHSPGSASPSQVLINLLSPLSSRRSPWWRTTGNPLERSSSLTPSRNRLLKPSFLLRSRTHKIEHVHAPVCLRERTLITDRQTHSRAVTHWLTVWRRSSQTQARVTGETKVRGDEEGRGGRVLCRIHFDAITRGRFEIYPLPPSSFLWHLRDIVSLALDLAILRNEKRDSTLFIHSTSGSEAKKRAKQDKLTVLDEM